ncbi:hypothetical protein [Mesoterricola silvestris]|uniref:Uncharacterized protein n=1 Tax=Mesoterricola silvestris TaxID=2927979 RepID=A0AA48GFJ1_9BACT|nr:hypothetical protein [Mesoterricola silvestris]BDU71711.1 hypothetical protein METEAL_08850 [Mesoterricola silvestris]
MNVELVEQEAELLKLLLVKELEETRVEIHHARNMDFKLGLEVREANLKTLLTRFQPVGLAK